jgi:hypothetical protein
LHIRSRPSREQEKKKDGFSLIFKNVNECSSGMKVGERVDEGVGGRMWIEREKRWFRVRDGTNLVIQSMKQGQ